MEKRSERAARLEEITKLHLEKCPPGIEFDVLQRVMRPDAFFLNHSHHFVARDLHFLLSRRFRNLRIRSFGSFEMGMAFRG